MSVDVNQSLVLFRVMRFHPKIDKKCFQTLVEKGQTRKIYEFAFYSPSYISSTMREIKATMGIFFAAC